ncbi:MAG: TIGR00282 family metallophosphoesterase [Alphaproteobacteria bacterium]|nr:TIGR00282 family metallophosphoesterase [Alphaproteobacteria bacterium]
MRILFFGDVMGRAGRDALMGKLPSLKKTYTPDIIIVNVENAAGGHGISTKIAQEFYAAGVHCQTTGNHVWQQKDMIISIQSMPWLIRPINYPAGTPGHGTFLHTLYDGRKILIANIMGQMVIQPTLEDPFAAAEKLVSQYRLGSAAQAIFVDFHAEVTSEKVAMGHFLDGRVSAVIGTHTHIPTADDHILPKGTAFQTDAGMCGDFDSVIGMKKELALWRFVKKMPGERLSPADGDATLCGTFVVTNDQTGLAESITAVQIGGHLKQSGPLKQKGA